MAQKQASPSPIKTFGFNSLDDTTYLYKPSKPETAVTDPGLVIICSWAFAQDKHITKYLTWYQQIYPFSRILLMKSSTHNLMWRPESWQETLFEPAILAIKDYVSSLGQSKPRVLLHLFSNGGAYTAVQLSQFYLPSSSSSTMRDPMLPVNALILDSSPSQPNLTLGTKALVQGLPKSPLTNIIGPIFVRTFLCITVILHYLNISEGVLSKLRRMLNDTTGPFLKECVPRAYIFSDADEVMDSSDIKLHAQQAIQALEAIGSTLAGGKIRCEEFVGSAHVNHMLKNPERYWNIVKDTWKAGDV